MNCKRLLRFYFSADKLNGALDNLIMHCACTSGESGKTGDMCAEKIMSIIQAKRNLSLLWGYLNAVMQAFDDDDMTYLAGYAFMRRGISTLEDEVRKNVRRVVVRFSRKAKNIERFAEGVRLVDTYYALLPSR